MATAPIVRGSELSARFKEQASVAALGAGGAFQSFHFYSENFQPGEGLVDDEELGGERHNLVDPTQQARALPKPTGQMSVPFDLNQIGWWLAAIWGAPTTDDTDDPVFEHVFKSGGTSMMLKGLELPTTTNVVRIVDAMGVSQMTIPMAKGDGFRQVDLTTLQRSVRRVTAALSASVVAAPARAKLTAARGLIKINGVNFGNALDGQLQMSNGGFMESYIDDTDYPSAVEIGRPSFQFAPKIRVRSDVKAVLDLFDGVTPLTLGVEFKITDDLMMTIACANVVATAILPQSQGAGAMELSPTFMASQTAAADMLTITLRNAIESYAAA